MGRMNATIDNYSWKQLIVIGILCQVMLKAYNLAIAWYRDANIQQLEKIMPK